MKIRRCGMEFELTGEEMIAAWQDVEKWSEIEELERQGKAIIIRPSMQEVGRLESD